MPRSIQIDDVPEELQVTLEARAANAGMSLSQYILSELNYITGNVIPPVSISVAVLPFTNTSNDSEYEYFSDGITEGIRARLSRMRDLRVIASSSTLRYKGRSVPLSELRSKLAVTHVLSGTVMRSESRVRVVVQLVDAATEQDAWAETYDRELTDVFAIQSDVTTCIAEALQTQLGKAIIPATAPPGTSDFEAYDLYLRARFHWHERTERSIDQSIGLLETALRLDPRYALAWAALADAYITLALSGGRAPNSVLEKAYAASQRALRIDPALGEALAALACVTAIHDWRWSVAEQLFQQAIARNRADPTTYQWYALNLLMPLGRFREAREALTHAWGVDPLSPLVNVGTGIMSYYARDYEAARDVCWQVVENEPSFSLAHYFLGLALEQLGARDEAIKALETAVSLSRRGVESVAALAHAYAVFGQRDAAEALIEELYARAHDHYISPVHLAAVEIGRGNTDEALRQIENAVDVRATELVWLPHRPVFDVLQGNPIFDGVIEQIGLSAGQPAPARDLPAPQQSPASS